MDCRVNQDFSVDERRSSRMLQLPYNRVNNTCECPPGWTGAYCKMCTTDEGCNTRYADWLTDKNGTMRCDTSMAMWNTVNSNMFNCLITDEVIISLVGGKVKMSGTCQGVALDRNNTNPEDSTCLVVGFSDIGYPPPDGAAMSQYMLDKTNELNLGALDQGESGELVAQLPDFANDPKIPPGYLTSIFYCYLHDCEETISDDHKTVVYSCKQTKCRATDHYPVSMGFKILLAGAKTYSAWTCNEETKVCLLSQEELGWSNLHMDCNAGECLYGDHPYPPVSPKDWTTEIIVGLILGSLIVLSGLLNAAYIIFSKYEDARKKQLWDKENVNGADSFAFTDVSYSLKLSDPRNGGSIYPTKKYILQDVSAHVSRGQILAIMGASGAGKTTLLDILGARRKSGTVRGDLFINGQYATGDYKRQIGYVTQEIQLMGTMTVRECLRFSANLRLPRNISSEEKERRVEEALQDLGISHIADRYIGTALRRGISGGEKRRVNIACELVISPTVLFLDEPTTGLDSYNALVVVECLKRLATKGKIIVLSIHQPRFNIFKMFDQLLLLSEGHTVYFGEANRAVKYFEQLGYTYEENTNPADFILDVVIKAAQTQRKNLRLPKSMQKDDSNELNHLVTHYRSVSGSMDNETLSDIVDKLNTTDLTDTENYSSTSKRDVSIQGTIDGRKPNGDAKKSAATNIQQKARHHHRARSGLALQGNVSSGDSDDLISSERTSLIPQVVRDRPPKNLLGMRKSSALIAMRGNTHSTSFYTQFYCLAVRTTKNFLRNFMLLPLHIGTAIMMSLFIGLCFWKLPMTIPVGLQNRMGAMFFTCALLGLTCMTSLELFISERAVFIAERANRYYGSWAYYCTKILFDIVPLRVIPPIIFGSISYFMIGLRYDGSIYYFLDYLLILVLFNVACGGITLTIATISPSVALGNMITLLLLFYFMLFGGFLLNNDNIPWYLAPLRFTSPFQFALEAMLSNELTGQIIELEVKNVGGLTKIPGDTVLINFGFNIQHYGLDLGMLVGLSTVFLIVPGILLFLFVKEKR